MFETRPEFEQPVPPPIAAEGSRYWRMMFLSSNLPWYLLRYRFRTDDGESFVQTAAIAWESTLRSVLEILGPDASVALTLLAMNHDDGAWTFGQVTEVWLATEQETQNTGPLLFRMQNAAELLSSHLEPEGASSVQRTLLARFS